MRLVVSGATSFLGEAFATAAAERGHAVVALVRRPSTNLDSLADEVVVVADVRAVQPQDLPEEADVVFHFATGTDGGVETMVDVATAGSAALLHAARLAGVSRFVHVSSMSVYPGRPRVDASRPDGRALEPHPERRGPYAWSKVAAELALAAEDTGSLHVDIVRPGLVFGPRMQSPLAGTAVRLPLGAAVGTGAPSQSVPLVTIDELNRRLLGLLDEPAAPGKIEVHDILSVTPTKAELLEAYHYLTGQARHVIWLPRPVAVGTARLFDGLRRARGTRSSVAYAMRRLYDFDPCNLDAVEAAAGTPHEKQVVHRALDAAITLNRTGDGEVSSANARAILGTWEAPAPDAPVRVVLVGAGRIVTEMHLPAIAALPQAAVVAVVDTNVHAAELVAGPLGAVVASELDDLPPSFVEGAVVAIATPGTTHCELVVQATGRHATVIVEKPAVLSTEQLDAIVEAASETAVDVFQNYRLRPAALGLWRFLSGHDVGPVRSASVTFHSPRIETERARWLRDELRNRALVVELGVHFLDLAFLVAGRLQKIHDLDVEADPRGGGLVRAAGRVETSAGSSVSFDLDISGVAQRTQLVFAFERATCVLDFFPDGFRLLPPRANPVDDVAAAAGRLGSALLQRARPKRDGVLRRALPHAAIYSAHMRACESGTPSPFAIQAIEPSMRSILDLADALYEPVAAG